MTYFLRVYKHLGCPHGCGDSQRGPPADFLRSQGQTILSKLQRSDPKKFSRFLRGFVRNQSLSEIVEFFHAYIGFCVDPSSLLSPLSKFHLIDRPKVRLSLHKLGTLTKKYAFTWLPAGSQPHISVNKHKYTWM